MAEAVELFLVTMVAIYFFLWLALTARNLFSASFLVFEYPATLSIFQPFWVLRMGITILPYVTSSELTALMG
jgi:hypothetical protein